MSYSKAITLNCVMLSSTINRSENLNRMQISIIDINLK